MLRNEKKPELQSADFVNVPHLYKVTHSREAKHDNNNGKIRILVVGCSGELGKAKKDTAKLLKTVAESSSSPLAPTFVVDLGDRFYSSGVSSPTESAFKTYFYDDIQDDLVRILTLGNHDHDLHNAHLVSTKGDVDDFKKANAQIQHTFMVNGVHSPELLEKFRGHTLDITTLRKWNCIGRVSCFVFEGDAKNGIKDTVMFFLDSSTYVRDELNSRGKEKDNPNNQANWFKRIYKLYPNAEIVVFMHHPIYTLDKRTLASDATVYLTQMEISQYPNNYNYNDMLRDAFQGFTFTLFAAHSHTLAYVYNESICQVISGGAGGPLQERWNFSEISMYNQNNGLVDVIIDPAARKENQPSMRFTFHTTDGQCLQFTNLNGNAVKRAIEPPEVVLFSELVIKASNQYFESLKTRPLKGWRYYASGPDPEAIKRTDQLINHCNRFEPHTDPQKLYDFVISKLQRWFKPGEKSMVTYLSILMNHHFKLTYENFVNNPSRFTEAVRLRQKRMPAGSATQPINIPTTAIAQPSEREMKAGSSSKSGLFGSYVVPAPCSAESSPSLVAVAPTSLSASPPKV